MREFWEDWRKEYIPERDKLAGQTEGDNLRSVVVRGAFLDAFGVDPRVESIIKDWQDRTGLPVVWHRMVVALGRLDALVSLDYSQLPWDAVTGFDVKVDDASQAAVSEADEALKAFLEAIHKLKETISSSSVFQEAKAFVVELGLPWPWLAIELVQLFLARLFAYDFRWHYLDGLSSEPDVFAEPAPVLELSFHTEAGETVVQALERMRREVGDVEARLLRFHEPLPPGTMPDKTNDSLKRYARWLYRHRVAGESIKSISRLDFGDFEHRKQVRDGIERAKELLSLTPYSF